MKRICKDCGIEKDWVYTNKRNLTGAKLYKDLNGSLWNSRRCPDCNKENMRKRAKKKTKKYKAIMDKI